MEKHREVYASQLRAAKGTVLDVNCGVPPTLPLAGCEHGFVQTAAVNAGFRPTPQIIEDIARLCALATDSEATFINQSFDRYFNM